MRINKYISILYFIAVALIFCWLYFVLMNLIKPEIFLANVDYFFRYDFFVQFIGALNKTAVNIISFCWFIAIIIISFRIGSFMISKLKFDICAVEHKIYSIGVGLICLIYLTALFGFSGLLYPSLFKTIIFILFAISIIKLKLKSARIFSGKLLKSLIHKTNFYQKLIILSLTPIMILNFMMIVAPEIFYDSLVYHLAVPNYYILHNKILPVEYLMHSNFPLNQQMLNLLALLLNNEILAKIIHSSMMFMTFILMFFTIKKFFSVNIAIIAVAIFAATPMLSFNAWTCGNDAALSFFFCLFFSAALNYINLKDKKMLTLCGLFAGCALSVKYTGIFAVSGILAVLLITLITPKISSSKKIMRIIFFLLCVIAPLLPWLLKNYFFTGNPFYPFFYAFFEDYQLKQFGGGGLIMIWSLNLFKFDYKQLFFLFWDNSKKDTIGIIYLCLIPLICFGLRKNKNHNTLIFGFIISYFFWSLGVADFRFFLPVFIILSVLIAVGLEKICVQVKTLNLLLPTLIIINFFFLNVELYKNIRIADYFTDKESKEEYLSKLRALYPVPPYPVIKWSNENLDKSAKILFVGESRPHYLKLDYISYSVEGNNQPLIEYLKKSTNAFEFYKLLRGKKITHFLVNYKEAIRVNPSYKTFYWNVNDRVVFDEFWKKHIRLVYFEKGVYLYEILENTTVETDNLLEILELRGWDNKILFDFFIENKMYDNMLDEYSIFYNYEIIYKNAIEHIKKLKMSQ